MIRCAYWLPLMLLGAASPLQAQAVPDAAPAERARSLQLLSIFFGNTLICGASVTGEDACHIWMEPDGRIGGYRGGSYTVGPQRKDGEVPVCFSTQSKDQKPQPRFPAEIVLPPSRMLDPNAGNVALCSNDPKQWRTNCKYVPRASLSETQIRAAMQWRRDNPICYPIEVNHQIGDVWFEKDDPLPTQDGLDKMWLIGGRM